jgi:hypothetical protein
VPGIGHPEDLGDAGLALDHQAMHSPQHVPHLVQVVLGGQPGPRDQPVVVGAALAIHQDELHRRGGGKLAEEVGNEHGLAEPGQPSNHDPETSASRTMTGRESSDQPSHQEVRLAGWMPDRSTRAGASSGSRASPRSRISPGPCCSARTLTQPQVSAR